VEDALRASERGNPGPYALQAAIAGVHAQAPRAEATDWRQIAALYALLARAAPSAIVELNRAVAVAMFAGPDIGLRILDELAGLEGYHLFHAARADLLRRLGRTDEALAAYRRARELAPNDAERRYLEKRVAQLDGGGAGA
jgi:RNA polymerase sigma-70 factor (ECF subfamily)